MKNHLLFYILFVLLGSCQCQLTKQPTVFATEEDYRVINATFVHLTNQLQQEFKPSFGYDNFRVSEKQLKESGLTIQDVCITPQLAPLNDSVFGEITDLDTKVFEDDSLRYLVTLLLRDTNGYRKLLAPDKITNIGLCRLKLPNKDLRDARTVQVTYSRIAYNKQQTKAFFYFQKSCYGLCGYATFVIVVKRNGIWEIEDTFGGWVS